MGVPCMFLLTTFSTTSHTTRAANHGTVTFEHVLKGINMATVFSKAYESVESRNARIPAW